MPVAGAVEPAFGVGDRIRKARKDAGLEQKDLALAVGVSRPLVSKWERNLAVPDLLQAVTIARVTHTPLGWIAGADPVIRWNPDSPHRTSVNTRRLRLVT